MGSLVSITDQKAVTTSLIVADAFQKQHRNVMKAIRELDCSDECNRLNFEPISYIDDRNRPQPAYEITRDGFAFLAMGFTGRRAAEFKERFIKAFSQMEQALLEQQEDVRRVDVNHSHVRGITNPHGLDVRYRLDLTKLCLSPTREGLEILQRLTGIDMSGIVVEAEPKLPPEFTAWLQTVTAIQTPAPRSVTSTTTSANGTPPKSTAAARPSPA